MTQLRVTVLVVLWVGGLAGAEAQAAAWYEPGAGSSSASEAEVDADADADPEVDAEAAADA